MECWGEGGSSVGSFNAKCVMESSTAVGGPPSCLLSHWLSGAASWWEILRFGVSLVFIPMQPIVQLVEKRDAQ